MEIPDELFCVFTTQILHLPSAKLQSHRIAANTVIKRRANELCAHIDKMQGRAINLRCVRLWFRESCGCLGGSGGGCEKFSVRPDWKVGVDAMAARMNIMHFSATMVLVAVATQAPPCAAPAGWTHPPLTDSPAAKHHSASQAYRCQIINCAFFRTLPAARLVCSRCEICTPGDTHAPSKTQRRHQNLPLSSIWCCWCSNIPRFALVFDFIIRPGADSMC